MREEEVRRLSPRINFYIKLMKGDGTMNAATETVARMAEIKQAMEVLRLGEWTDDLLDEIELNRRLKISLEQDDKGLTMSLEEMEKELLERKAKNGYYSNRR
jgi:hypothetical protein